MRSQLLPAEAARLGSHLKWAPWVFGAVVLGVGVGTDLRPDLGTPLSYVFIASLLVMAYLPRSMRSDSESGYRRSPTARSVGMRVVTLVLSRITLLLLVIGFGVARLVLRIWDVPMPTTVSCLLIIVTMPLWGRALNRTPA